MIKRIFEWILNQTIGRLWRQHESSVLCNTAVEDRARDLDFVMMNPDSLPKEQIDQMTQELFIENAEPFEKLDGLVEDLKTETLDILKIIVVTTETPPGSILDCRYEGMRYALINPEDWEKVKKSIASRPADAPRSPLWGIPAIRDDELARKILIGAIVERQHKKRKRPKPGRWN